jgi:translation initiation factor IF-2
MPAQAHPRRPGELDGIAPRLTPDGRGIALPAGRLNPAQRAAIAANRPALLAHLSKAQAARTSLAPAAAPTAAPAAPAAPLAAYHLVQRPAALARCRPALRAATTGQCATCRAAARGHSRPLPRRPAPAHAECAAQVRAAHAAARPLNPVLAPPDHPAPAPPHPRPKKDRHQRPSHARNLQTNPTP